MDKWQPIATAPHDGTYVLLTPCVTLDDVQSGSFRKSHDEKRAKRWRPFNASKVDDRVYWIPHYWMPLPRPPFPAVPGVVR